MSDRIDNPSQPQPANDYPTAGDQPVARWADDGTGLVIARPADFTDAQWLRMMDTMRAWWDEYREKFVEETAVRHALNDCPEAPPCTPWCTVEHEDMHKGWERLEKHVDRLIPRSAQKDCYAQLGFAQCDDGTIAVELHRLACVAHLGSRWDRMYVGDETVSMHPDNEFSRMNAGQLEEFLAILECGADALSIARSETGLAQ